jgi:ribosome recycling factor
MDPEELVKEVLSEAEGKMKKAVADLQHDLSGVRTGRANAGLVERLEVEYYGSRMPINQLGTISVPEARLLVISPWDKNALGPIERAIKTSDLNINPTNDGQVVRLGFPPLTEERRRDLTKVVARKVEEHKVAVRNIRRHAMDELKSFKKDGDIAEDDERRAEDRLQKLTDQYIHQMDQAHKVKDAELMEV